MDTNTMLSINDNTAMDDARRTIYEEIQQCERRILGLRSQLNRYTSVAKLPPEILLQIFAKLTEDGGLVDSIKCVPITHVSRQWRSLALDAPALWTNLSSINLHWTIAMLERSKGAPLTVLMDEKSYLVPVPILKHLSRVKSLTIENWSAGELQKLHILIENNASVAPQLEVLSISCNGTSPWVLPSTTFQQTDRLNNLFLHDVHINWNHLPLLRNLMELRIESDWTGSQPTWRELITALNRMPTLKSLFLGAMLPMVPFEATLDAIPAHLPNLESIVFGSVYTMRSVVTFLNQVKLPPDLKAFIISNFNTYYPNRGEVHEVYDAINRSLPDLCSKATYMYMRHWPWTGNFDINCFATLPDRFYDQLYDPNDETNPACIGFRLSYTSGGDRITVVADAVNILKLNHIRYLRIGEDIGDPELHILLQYLPELRIIQAFERATVHLIQALNLIQPGGVREGASILTNLVEIRVCKDHDLIRQEDCVLTDDTWQNLKAFLEHRQSLQAGIHRLYIQDCRYVSKEMVEGLKKCVGDLCWDGICKEHR
ncbi:hypothetical protein D9619_001173 [Psilocybe cf. subviscida]|uniref:F-box domain-containing protein n=1 Tax=Psilocybe cf. subviscida TaxID=2480587 RepID=A0A8H5BE09_9AGAR|nr:hypothetical protein D9619_001173 [Psilocybe cf. subviscida]